MEDRRETGKVDTGMVAVLAIATLLFGTVQWWKLPLDRALERLGLLHRHRDRPHAEPTPHPSEGEPIADGAPAINTTGQHRNHRG